MQIWLGNKWDDLRSNFWFVPSVMVVSAILLSLATLHLDKITSANHDNRVATLGWTFTRGPEGSRAVLSAVAGSMMTIASVTFSITIVALQLASSQFGPRLLRGFMRDRGNQIAMGTFIATFTYSLLVLRTINGTEGSQFVPHISVTVGLFLALFSLGVLIYFIHHAAESIQAENVIAAVSREMLRAIERLYPGEVGQEPSSSKPAGGKWDIPPNFIEESRPIVAKASDYLQAIDDNRLLEVATEHDLIISVVNRPGKFLFEGSDISRIWPKDRATDDVIKQVHKAFFIGRRRTLRQDVEFAIDQIVEVAVRALSPGINDPFTAINCIDRLGAALCVLVSKEIPSPLRYDENHHLRVMTDTSTAAGIIDAAFNMIRQAARKDEAVTLRLFESIIAISRCTRNPDFLEALQRHADLIHRGSQEGLEDQADREDADDRHEQALQAINSDAPPREIGG